MVGRSRKDTFHCRPVHSDAQSSLNRLITMEDQAILLQALVNIEEEVQHEAHVTNLNLDVHDDDDDREIDLNDL